MTEQKYEHEIATVNSRIDRIEVTLNHAVDAIEKIVDVVNKPEETKWGPILTAVGLLFMAAGGYTTLVTTPMKSRIEHLETENKMLIQYQIENAREHGKIEGRLGIDIGNESQ